MTATPRAFRFAVPLACAFVAASALAQKDVTVIPVTGAEVTSELTGTVEVVNLERRMLTIKTPDGKFQVIHVPDEVNRLDEVKIGNRLTITETEAVLVDLVKGADPAAVGSTQEKLVDRETGAKPAGSITETLTLYGRVESIDKANRKVTVKGSSERVVLSVTDPSLMNELAVGDGVVATFIRTIKGKVDFR